MRNLNLRINPELARKLKKLRAEHSVNVSDFVRQATEEKADKVLATKIQVETPKRR